MNQAQHDYLAQLVRHEFDRQGYRGGIHREPQVEAAIKIVGAAIKAQAPVEGTWEGSELGYYAHRAVGIVRSARLHNVPAGARTVQPCRCGKPKGPHLASLHEAHS